MATVEDAFKLRPINLLLSRAIASYSKQGFRFFDFNPSGGHEKVSDFKRHLGGVPVPAPLFVHRSFLTRAIFAGQRVKSRLARM